MRRIEAGLSLEDVSKELGVLPGVVQNWESGNVQPPSHVMRALDVIRSFAVKFVAEAQMATSTEAGTGPKTSSGSSISRSFDEQGAPATKSDASGIGLIKSKKRVADHGEVFTPSWLVEKMLDLIKGESERIDARFLEPACGSGNFLVPILQRKLAAVELKFGKSDFEKKHHALQALTCCYGIELLADNIAECRSNMLDVFAAYLNLDETEELYRAATHILSLNLVHGDAMTMRGHDGEPMSVVEWGYLGKGKFQRRDFRLDVLTGMSAFREEATLFAHLGKHDIFKPTGSHPPMTVRELAAQEPEHTL